MARSDSCRYCSLGQHALAFTIPPLLHDHADMLIGCECLLYPIVKAEDSTTFDVKLDQLLTDKRNLARDMLNINGDVGPGDFNLAGVVPADGADGLSDEITIHDVVQMQWDYYESLIAVLWLKKGYRLLYRNSTHDDGVDVVAISCTVGVLLQCKTRSSDDASLDWEAVKDVVAGEAAYRRRRPGVQFKKACITISSLIRRLRGTQNDPLP